MSSSTAARTDVLVPADLPCRTHDPELWFAEHREQVEQAKALCRGCSLRPGCLNAALARGEPWGVWGGEVLRDGVVVSGKRGRGRPRTRVRVDPPRRRHVPAGGPDTGA
ncbi:WhiB family transcriptional regulator [Georgenia alba]|uniref:Transcriptional regulator WhiB n=1 Tax=Georgenia alba TaxID=2233858 RepID=A0ABW2Q3G4_9MICO